MAWWRKLKCNVCEYEWEQLFDKKNQKIVCRKCEGEDGKVVGVEKTKAFGTKTKASKSVDYVWEHMQNMGFTNMKDNAKEGETVLMSPPALKMPDNPVSRAMEASGGFYQNTGSLSSNLNAAATLRQSVSAADPLAGVASSIKNFGDPLKTGPRIVE